MTLIDASKDFVRASNRLPGLFDLDDQQLAILALIDDAEQSGEEPVGGLEAQLALVEAALAQKVENYCGLVRTLESLRDARKAEADRLRARAGTADRAADWLKQRLKLHMESTGQQRIETPRFTVAIAASPPRVEVLTEMLIPSEFKKTVITETLDKRKVLDHVKAGGDVPPGVEIMHGTHLRLS